MSVRCFDVTGLLELSIELDLRVSGEPQRARDARFGGERKQKIVVVDERSEDEGTSLVSADELRERSCRVAFRGPPCRSERDSLVGADETMAHVGKARQDHDLAGLVQKQSPEGPGNRRQEAIENG